MRAVSTGSPTTRPRGLGMVYTAVPGAFTAGNVAHSAAPKMGSVPAATAGLPPSDVTVCGAAVPKRSDPVASSARLGKTNGPPGGDVKGHVWVKAVTAPGAGGVPRWRR